MHRAANNHRLTKARVLAAMTLAALAFVAVHFVLTNFPGGSVPLLTGENSHDGTEGCYLNWFVEELVVDPVNGTAFTSSFMTEDGPKTVVRPIKWPAGYTGRRSGVEVEVLNREGQVVARTGATYRIQGGYEGDYWLTCNYPPVLSWTPQPVAW